MSLVALYPIGSSSSINDQWERSGTRRFMAAFSSTDDENYVRANLDPTLIINYPHPTDASQVVANISVTQIEDLSKFPNLASAYANADVYFWWADVSYGPWNPLLHTSTGDPADQPISFGFDWQYYDEAVDVAWNPSTSAYVPVVNSAGDPFDPPVTRETLKGIMRVAYNSHTFSPATFFAYGNQINSDVWNDFPIGSIKVTPPKMPERLFSQRLLDTVPTTLGLYYRLELEMCFFPSNGAGWNATPIDRGYRALNGSGALYKILDVNGQPISQPALLNGSGVPLTPGTLSGYYQYNYQIYNSISFATTFPNLTTLF